MKKTTNSNPLKYFNDAAAAKKKIVTAGTDKLVKAQYGIAGNPVPNVNDDYMKKRQQDDYTKKIKERDIKYNKQMSEESERRRNNTSATPTPTPIPAATPYKPYPSLEKEMNKRKSSANPYKKGGSVKSKKK